MLQMSEPGKSGGMYYDLAEAFHNEGHSVTVMAPDNNYASSYMREENGLKVIRVKCRKVLGESNLIKKGIAMALMPSYYKKAFQKYLKKEEFDWIFMPTPPITLIDFVKYVKKKTRANFYLILRDIHPQSVASIGLLKHKFMYDYLERRAKKGYEIADLIGCMSQGNIDFIKSNYPYVDRSKLVILYNWLKKEYLPEVNISELKEKYDLKDKIIALFGGTIGLGQRIENLIMLAESFRENNSVRFLIIGKGIEKDRLMKMSSERRLTNMIFLDYMPQSEYLTFMSNADIGLISINENYKVPTCPSKAVAYMSYGIPIFAIINSNNDYRDFIEENGTGFAVVGGNKKEIIDKFTKLINDNSLRKSMSDNGKDFYKKNLTVNHAVSSIMSQINGRK